MAVRVTIETASKAEAERIAALLAQDAEPESWRGFGVIRLGRRSEAETADVMEAVATGVERHDVRWARVRYDDEERVFRSNGRR